MNTSSAAFLAAIAVRTAIVLIALFVGLRLLGKRKIGELQIWDLMLVLVISNAVQNSMTEGIGPLPVALVSASTLLLLGWLVARVLVRHPAWESRIMGSPTVLVEHGRLIRRNLSHEHVDEQEVMMALRQQGLAALNQVRLAILEIDGTISVVPNEPDQPQPARPNYAAEPKLADRQHTDQQHTDQQKEDQPDG